MYLVHALFALLSLFAAAPVQQQTGCTMPTSWVGWIDQSQITGNWELAIETNGPNGGSAFLLEEYADPHDEWTQYLWSGQPQVVKNLHAFSWAIMQNQTPSCPLTTQLNAWKAKLIKLKYEPLNGGGNTF